MFSNTTFIGAMVYLIAIGIPATAFSIWIPRYFKAVSRQPEVASTLLPPLMIFFGALEVCTLVGLLFSGLLIYKG